MSDEITTPKEAHRGIARNATQIVSDLTTKFNEAARAFADHNPFLVAQKREDEIKKDKD